MSAYHRSPPRLSPPLSSFLQRLHLHSPLLFVLIAVLVVLIVFCSIAFPSRPSLLPSLSSPSDMADSSSASPLLALNICLLPPPGHPIYERAHRLQSLLLSSFPSDYSFSSTRFAHVTLVQAYIEATALPALVAALKEEVSAREASSGEAPLTVTMKSDLVGGSQQEGLFVPSIAIAPSPQLLSLHSRVMAVVRRFRVPSSSPLLQSVEGRRAAFYREAHEGPIGMPIVDYVGHFEEKSAGDRYYPHVSLGVVDETTLKALQAEEEHRKDTHKGEGEGWTVENVFVFQLGNWGTVRKRLDDFPLPSSTARK